MVSPVGIGTHDFIMAFRPCKKCTLQPKKATLQLFGLTTSQGLKVCKNIFILSLKLMRTVVYYKKKKKLNMFFAVDLF
jgi:hypothetical protein